MKKSMAVLFIAAILVLSAPANAQVRPFSQLTSHAFDAAQAGMASQVPYIHINIGPGGDEDRDSNADQDRDNGNNRDNDRNRDRGDIGGWGGFGFGYFLPRLNGFDGLTKDRGLNADFPLMDTWSGRGFVSWDGFRFGGMGGYGSYHLTDVVQGEDRSAALHVGYGGVTFDYLLPLGTDRVGLLLGGAMGGGGTWISAHGDDLGGDHRWGKYTGFRFFAPEA